MIQRIKNIYRDAFTILKEDFLYYIGILVVARLISLWAIELVSKKMFSFTLSLSGLVSINSDNLSTVLTHPVLILLLVIVLFSVGFFMLLENAIILNYANRFYTTGKISFKKIVSIVFSPYSILFILYLILILPNVGFGMSASYLSNFKIPRFIIDAIYEQDWMTYAYFVVFIMAFFLNLYLYYLPAVFLLEEDIGFIEACKKSIKMVKGELFEVVIFKLTLAVSVFIFAAFVYGLSFGVVSLAARFNFPFLSILTAIATSLFFLSTLIAISLQTVLQHLSLLSRYHKNLNDPILTPKNSNSTKFYKDLLWVTCIVIFGFGIMTAYTYQDNIITNRTALIASHRGDTSRAIENTIESLRFANELGADLVELDIQKTKDDVIVVFHDDNLSRLSNTKSRVDEMTWNEIQKRTLSNGKFKSTIPDFDTYLKESKALNQELLLELKAIRGDVDAFVHDTMALIDKYEYREHIIIQSLDKKIVESMKKHYPEMKVGFILGFNVGGFEEIGADFYSVEDSSIKKNTIQNLTKRNKGLYVWTVNTKDRMNHYFDADVNGIITDNVPLALEERERVPDTSLVTKIWDIVLK